MAEIKLFEFADYKTPAVSYKIGVWVNDANGALIVRRFGESRTRIITSNANDPYPEGSHIGTTIDYSYCRGTDLVQFKAIATFPYAEEVITANASVCNRPVQCDLKVVTVDTTGETVTGAGDGTATVNAAGTWPGIEYSLDNVNYQASNSFTRLDPGAYTVYIRDSKGCTAQGSFTIADGDPAAYGLRYFLDYDNYKGKLYGLKIYKKFYTGAPEPVDGEGQPMDIRYLFNGGRFGTLIGSELTTRLIFYVREQFIEFFTSDEREYRVELWDNETDTLLWRGFSLPDVYSQPFISPVEVVSIVATDGMGTLKDRPFLDSGGRPYVGKRTLMEIILLCLQKLDLELPIWESANWYETSMTIDEELSPLVQLKQDLGEFYDAEKGEAWTCEEVLSKTLANLKLQLMQSEGHWVLFQPNWIYREPVQEEPPPPTYPALSFSLDDARISLQEGGIVNIVGAQGGNPADGQLQVSVNGTNWKNLSSLEQVLPGIYKYTGLTIGFSGIMYLRRENKPDVTAQQPFTIPNLASQSLTITANHNILTANGSATLRRTGGEEDLTINYESWTVPALGSEEVATQVGTGALTMPAGTTLAFRQLEGRYYFGKKYELRIISVQPANYLYQSTIPIAPVGGLPL